MPNSYRPYNWFVVLNDECRALVVGISNLDLLDGRQLDVDTGRLLVSHLGCLVSFYTDQACVFSTLSAQDQIS